MRTGILVFLFAFLFLGSTEAFSENFLGREIVPVIPNGYCELGNHPVDVEIARSTQEAIAKTANKIVSIFVECSELEALRNHENIILKNYGHILMRTKDGDPYVINGESRTGYIEKVSKNFNSVPEKLDDIYGKLKIFVKQYNPPYNLGILSLDNNGLYWGIALYPYDAYGGQKPTILITGVTLIKELQFSINLYKSYDKNFDLKEFLNCQREAMRSFVKANN